MAQESTHRRFTGVRRARGFLCRVSGAAWGGAPLSGAAWGGAPLSSAAWGGALSSCAAWGRAPLVFIFSVVFCLCSLISFQ